MNNRYTLLLLPLFLTTTIALAQKPFTEGTIVYNVKLHTPEQTEFTGVYTFNVKGSEIRKELKLSNGFEDVVIFNYSTGKAYSLQKHGGKKYAVELDIADITRKQQKFADFTVRAEEKDSRTIAGYATYKGNITYRDGYATEVYYTKEWSPTLPIMFERFPNAKFMPVSFAYKDDNGLIMQFDAVRINPSPTESGIFRVPAEYKIISNAEYKQMNK